LLLLIDPDPTATAALAAALADRYIDVVATCDPADALLQPGDLPPDAVLHAGRVVTRTQINQLIWSRDDETSNTLNVHIRRLRACLGDNPRHPTTIVSVRGLGYRLDPAPQVTTGLDLPLLLNGAGHKHTVAQVRSLFERSGLRFVGVRPTGTFLSFVEAVVPDEPQ
jgi:hypothetical protein